MWTPSGVKEKPKKRLQWKGFQCWILNFLLRLSPYQLQFGEPGEECVPRSTRGQSFCWLPIAFSTTITVKDKRWDKLRFTKYAALIKSLPRALNATACSAEWNLKGFLVQLDCFSDVQPNCKYLLSIQDRLEIACTQSYFYKASTFCCKWKHHSNILVMLCLGFQFQS